MIGRLRGDPTLEQRDALTRPEQPVITAEIADEGESAVDAVSKRRIIGERRDVGRDTSERGVQIQQGARVVHGAGYFFARMDEIGCDHEPLDIILAVGGDRARIEVREFFDEGVPPARDDGPGKAGLKDRACDDLEMIGQFGRADTPRNEIRRCRGS